MAFLAMTSSFVATPQIADCRRSTTPRLHVVAKASVRANLQGTTELKPGTHKGNEGSARRTLILAAAAATMCSISRGMAMAGEDAKPGSVEARKFYAPVCVTMPTAKICHK